MKNLHKYIYVIVRNDLSSPQKAVQSCHASMESSRKFLKQGDEHPSVIILVVKDEKRLHKLANDVPYKFVKFFEPDIGNQMTAIATEPIAGEQRDFFKRFQLLY
jgi:hypothetical protein